MTVDPITETAMSEPGVTRPGEAATWWFWRHVVVKAGEECWPWTGVKTHEGYGRVYVRGTGRNGQAHRWAYQLTVGPIPVGFHIDHLCRNRDCVNPSHLEPVTPAENTRRAYAAKTHCKRGHEFTPDNTKLNGKGHRVCRTCVDLVRDVWEAAHPEECRNYELKRQAQRREQRAAARLAREEPTDAR